MNLSIPVLGIADSSSEDGRIIIFLGCGHCALKGELIGGTNWTQWIIKKEQDKDEKQEDDEEGKEDKKEGKLKWWWCTLKPQPSGGRERPDP